MTAAKRSQLVCFHRTKPPPAHALCLDLAAREHTQVTSGDFFTPPTEELGALCEFHSGKTPAQEAAVRVFSLASHPSLSCWGWEGRDLPPSRWNQFLGPLVLFHAPMKPVFSRQRVEGAHGSFTPPMTTEIRGL